MSDEKFRFGLDQNKQYGKGDKDPVFLPENLFSVKQLIPDIPDSKVKTQKKAQRKVNPKNTRNLEPYDLKNLGWEKVTRSSNLKNSKKSDDLRSVRPSVSDISRENDYGGTGILPGVGNTIKDPNLIKKNKGSKMSKDVIKEAKERRERIENRHKRPEESRNEWEKVTRAKTTKDIPSGQMGFNPNRTSYEQQKTEEISTIPAIENIKKNNIKSEIAGKKAAKIKTELDNIMAERNKMNVESNWEKEAQDKIYNTLSKKIKSEPIGIELSKPESISPSPSKTKIDLSKVFSIPKDPQDFKEPSIKRNSSNLKDKRLKRQDDRSWEKVRLNKKLGRF